MAKAIGFDFKDNKYYIEDPKYQNLYKFMWNDSSRIPGGDTEICKTSTFNKENKSKESNRSYSFRVAGLQDKYTAEKKVNDENKEKICQQLIKNFNIQNKNQFREKFYNEACSGDGGEAAKITRLHSSSLCAFLFFYNVNNDNKISIEIENGKICEFDEVYFEIKNTVIKKRKPSNIDVVLISKSSRIILYLESKFAEYYLSNGSIEVSSDYLCKEDCKIGHQLYKQISNDIDFKKIGLKINFDSGKDGVFKIESNKNIEDINNKKKYVSYCGGIKQMISHYIGLYNFVNGEIFDQDSRNKKLKDLFDSGFSIYLGEILFDFDNEKIIKFREDYEKKYEKLAGLLNNSTNNTSKTKVKCLSEVKYYSDLKKFVNPTIKNFYFGE